MNWTVSFFDLSVMTDIQEWPLGIKAKFTWIVELMEEYGPMDIGMPHVKALGKGLFELRVKAKEGIGRAIFCILQGKKIVILNGFIKKTQKTPSRELDLANKRMKEVNRNEEKY